MLKINENHNALLAETTGFFPEGFLDSDLCEVIYLMGAQRFFNGIKV
jgi:hypothetical protein